MRVNQGDRFTMAHVAWWLRSICSRESGLHLNLLTQLKLHFNIYRSDFTLSLNGKDPIDGQDGTELGDLGIVSGDLITLLVDRETLEQFADQPPQPPPQPVAQMSQNESASTSSSDATGSVDGKQKEGTIPSFNVPIIHVIQNLPNSYLSTLYIVTFPLFLYQLIFIKRCLPSSYK